MKNKNYLSQVANSVMPYLWEDGIKENWLRFDSNTLPFPPKSLPLFFAEMKKSCLINEYADPTYKKLKELIAKYEKVSTDMITITNSGDEAIDILAKTFLNPGDYFIVTPPTYEMFAIQCTINNGKVLEIPLEKELWNVNANPLIKASKNPRTKLMFLVNPNNPTGSIISIETIKTILNKSDCIVVIDEAYREFYGKTAVPLIGQYENLVILRSFSKFAALAGARIGYLIANPALSQKFDGIRFPMGVSYLSYKLAETVLRSDKQWIKKQIAMIKKERERLTKSISRFGYTVYPSQGNFLLVKIGNSAKDVCKKLREKGIVVRDRSSKKYLEGCVRISVRSPKENDVLLKALKEIINTKKYAFIDRDGTLIFEPQDTYQIDSLKKLKILDGVIDGLKKLINQKYELIMVTNQDGLGTSSFPKKDFEVPQNKMLNILEKNGIKFKEIFICPHFDEDKCNCRKPKLGLLKNFLSENPINTDRSFVCGDRDSDKQLANNLGLNFIPMKTNGNFYEALIRKGVIL